MIILDTNVISEFMRSAPDAAALTWLRRLQEQPVTTVVNRAEVLAGIAVLAAGRRRDELRSRAEAAFDRLGQVLPLSGTSAAHYADIVADRRRAGRPIGSMDALIAAIARERDCAVATRDVEGFSGLGIDLVDPWRGR